MSLILKDVLENPKVYETELKGTLPFLFPNNEMAKAQWQLKLLQFQATNKKHLDQLQRDLNQVKLLPATKKRLESLVQAHSRREKEIENLFSEIGLKHTQNESLKNLLSNRIPSRQHVESYYMNIFRDWCWGENENSCYNQIVEKMGDENGDFLVLGGGAGRLSYDLCQIFDHWNVVQLDINPLLSLIGHKLSRGEKIELTEIASEPLSNDKLFEIRELEGLGSIPNQRLQFVLGDASAPPFKAASFNGIITPWLIDIIPEPFESFSRRLNPLIKPGGHWVNFGPLSFERQRPLAQLTPEEVEAQLELAGFQIKDSGWMEVPYLQSPIRAQHRREKIFWFVAEKLKSCKAPAAFHFYPPWFEDPNLKANLANTNIESLFAQKNLEANLLGSLIQGSSLTGMIRTLVEKAQMSQEEAESLVLGTFNRLLESGELVSN